MNYSRKKAREITNFIEKLTGHHVSESDELMLEIKIKEIQRDIKHRCAENVLLLNPNGGLVKVGHAHNAVMNTSLD